MVDDKSSWDGVGCTDLQGDWPSQLAVDELTEGLIGVIVKGNIVLGQ